MQPLYSSFPGSISGADGQCSFALPVKELRQDVFDFSNAGLHFTEQKHLVNVQARISGSERPSGVLAIEVEIGFPRRPSGLYRVPLIHFQATKGQSESALDLIGRSTQIDAQNEAPVLNREREEIGLTDVVRVLTQIEKGSLPRLRFDLELEV